MIVITQSKKSQLINEAVF